MTDHIHLTGSEDVQRAGRTIASAADTMRSAGLQIDESLRLFLQRFEELVVRLERALDGEE